MNRADYGWCRNCEKQTTHEWRGDDLCCAECHWIAFSSHAPKEKVRESVEIIKGLMGLVQLISHGDGKDHTKNHRYQDAEQYLSQFTERAGGQVVPDSKSSDGAQEAQTAGEPAPSAASEIEYITGEQIRKIESLAEMKGIKNRLTARLVASGIKTVDKIPSSKYSSVIEWLDAR